MANFRSGSTFPGTTALSATGTDSYLARIDNADVVTAEVVNSLANSVIKTQRALLDNQPMTTLGDLTIGGLSGIPTRLPIGSPGQVLTVVAGVPSWQTFSALTDPMTSIGDIIIRNLLNTTTRLPAGVEGTVLTVSGGIPTWLTPVTGFADPMTTTGDMIYRSNTGTTRLASGSSGQFLRMSGGIPTWQTFTALSDPMSATGDLIYRDTNNNTVRLPIGPAGTILQSSGATPSWTTPTSITLQNLSAFNSTPSGAGSLSYDNGTGVFTLTPPDLSTYTLSSSLAVVATTGSYVDLLNRPTLATVATSGSYTDLINKPSILIDPMTTNGDMIYRTGGATSRLAAGSDGTVLKIVSGAPTWSTAFDDPTNTTGDLIYRSSTGTTRLAVGTAGQFLRVSSGVPTWQSVTLYTDPLTTTGDIIYRSSTGTTRLAAGSNNQFLRMSGGLPAWQTFDAFVDPLTTPGDLLYKNDSSTTARLAAGSPGQFLRINPSGIPFWQTYTALSDPMTTNGDMIYRTGGTTTRLPAGTEGTVLKIISGVPAWGAAGLADPMTATGDLIYRSSTGTTRLAAGTTGQFLRISGGIPTWQTFTALSDPTTSTGDLIYRSGSGIARLNIGSEGTVLTVVSGVPTWQVASSGFSDPMTTNGDMIYRTGGTTTRLAAGSEGTVLKIVSGVPTWSAATGGGGISLTDLSVGPNGLPAGSGGLSYDNLTGAFTYTPPALDGYALSSSLATVATSGSYNDLTNKPSLFSDPMTTTGDLIYRSGTGTTRLGIGSNGTVLTVVSGVPTWQTSGTTLSVTNSGASAYTINGSSNPMISFIRGYRYLINVNSPGHPFWIQTVSGAYSSGNVYSNGVTNNGTDNGTIEFQVPYNAPANLYYVCQYHPSMAGSVITSDLGPGSYNDLTNKPSTLLASRGTASATTASINDTQSDNITVTGFKCYTLFKVATSAAAWVVIYTDTTSRTNDASRSESTDPAPGSGVLAEVVTTGAQTILMTPTVVGFNNDSPLSNNIYLKVTNKSGSTQAITVTLTMLQLEA